MAHASVCQGIIGSPAAPQSAYYINVRSTFNPIVPKGTVIFHFNSTKNEPLLVYEDDDQFENDISM